MVVEIVVAAVVAIGSVIAYLERVALRAEAKNAKAWARVIMASRTVATKAEVEKVIAEAKAEATKLEADAKVDVKSIEGKIEALVAKAEADLKKVL